MNLVVSPGSENLVVAARGGASMTLVLTKGKHCGIGDSERGARRERLMDFR
ncbi:Uncharacterised protein [Mycobacteroides abscessus]|uniref:Uncharacterized protein n=3 Tax=Mycobacteroides abscessus TaxID=36809 RepID=A0A829MC14_9MYCO|nr:hypothetical protein MASS_2499 [Mycobacteroides abscessus subsp. bolletii 50594]EIU62110.1 hypothetical protein MM1S1510930_2440 [Mycobacteroides abscessus subsp. bolletii 1S-151-0930]EIU70374.1 hypothetical protein MM1S1520914_2646 [Mycobacteroides abscessus subsp. bolletii 1S-152-0914]EIU75012.1 hypothetical protein MM1S1530915_1987 [Mycobacteroides abscessus subsp. bolletii 1S-153-0915]EIU81144.1 hypothetical protein MM1S1540310_1999 [Mycobacteroides abscessus subsp. bolletii 1S-154-0310]